jgi:hypothetical protein
VGYGWGIMGKYAIPRLRNWNYYVKLSLEVRLDNKIMISG